MKKVLGSTLALSAACLIGCLEPAGMQGGETASDAPSTPNNSDPSKPGFTPADSLFPKVQSAPGDGVERTPGYKGLEAYRAERRNRPAGKAAASTSHVGIFPLYKHQWSWPCPAENRVWIKQDDEDTGNESRASASTHFGMADGDSRNTTFYWCKVSIPDLAPLYDANAGNPALVKNDFAVLSLGDVCPGTGGRRFAVQVDNEDTRNANANSGENILPNVQDKLVTRLYFCFYAATPNSGAGGLPSVGDFGRDYAVFASSNVATDAGPFKQKYWVYSDDEDTNNINYQLWYDVPVADQERARRVISTSSLGTLYNMAAIR